VAHVRGRGLVIVTGWGHAGIVNIVRQAKRLTGVDLYDAMPQAYRPNSVGSRFELKAAPERIQAPQWRAQRVGRR
jgi:hypothetical protein